MQQTNEKKLLVLSFLGVLTFIAVVVGATYAYFTAQGGGTGNINVNATTNTTDNLSFQVGEAISLTANQEDFGQGTGNKSGSTYARAVLTANNTTNTATRNYYVYLNILNNNFEYTTEDEQGEILLKVTDPDGTEVTSIPGLTRKTSGTGDNQVTGFDITTKTGSITIADNYEITASPSTTQEWQVEVIFVNLDSDQNANTNKTFNANLIVREDSPIGITEVSTSNITRDSITLTVNATSENEITNYYFAKNEEEYVSSASNTYTFSGLDAGTEYTLKVYAVDDEGYQSAVYNIEVSTVIGNFAKYITTELYTGTDGDNGLYYHDADLANGAQDNSYRYSGANPNNYVCFESDEETCPAENLYRIIGVFNGQVKLIKAISYGEYSWGDNENINTWNTDIKPDIYTTLNNLFYNSLGIEWQDLISLHDYNVEGMSQNDSFGVKQYYDAEIKNNNGYNQNMKIGLMYVTDYGYAASPESWTIEMFNYDDSKNINWLSGITEWTISRRADVTGYTFRIDESGYVRGDYYVAFAFSIRPSFYLNSDVEIYESHAGTVSDPYRIVI